jgi:hypothetical protein
LSWSILKRRSDLSNDGVIAKVWRVERRLVRVVLIMCCG